MDICKTVKVKPWGEGQGDYVEINAADFDPAIHAPFDPLDHDANGVKGGSLPRARRKKAAE